MKFAYDEYGDEVKRLIDVSINEAIDLVDCMDEDSPEVELENRTRAQYRNYIGDTAVDCFKRALDPEDYDMVRLPVSLIMAITSRVTETVTFRARVL